MTSHRNTKTHGQATADDSPRPQGASQESPALEARGVFWTIPNVLCLIRLCGAPLLIVLAMFDWSFGVLVAFVLLASTDWIDGKLAIWLDQRSDYGAQLDSWADATLYGSLLIASLMLHWDRLSYEQPWLWAAVGSYAVATVAGLWKFRRWPSYHTYAAKISWWLCSIGAVFLLAESTLWPLRIGLAAVTFTNLEALLMTLLLPQWQADVRSVLLIRKNSV